MSAQTITSSLWSGFAATAAALGFPYRHYRPTGADAPVGGTPLNPALLVAASAGPSGFGAPGWGRPVRFLYLDGAQTAAGDYLTAGPLGTLAIVSQEPMQPILGIACNHVLTFKRPSAAQGLGMQSGYGGDLQAQEAALLTAWPAWVGSAGGGGHGAAGLPGDAGMPRMDIRLPCWPGVTLLNGDMIFDEQGRRYQTISAEASRLGWRIAAVLAMS